MIHGIGTDIVAVARMAELWQRHSERAMVKILAPAEHADCLDSSDRPRFLAKRFAAKEALAKAMGTGMRAPVVMPSISIVHDELGKPIFRFEPELARVLTGLKLVAHLSLSDERDYAVAFVVLERI